MPRAVAYLYVPEGMADWEPALVMAELASGRFFRPGAPGLVTRVCTVSGWPARSMGGLTIRPDAAVADIREEDAALLVLPGADGWLDPAHDAALEKARAILAAGVPVAAICGATLGLARAGLLAGRAHTSNSPEFLRTFCPGYAGEELYRSAPAVTDRGLITAGGTAPLAFAVEILRLLDAFAPAVLEAWSALHRTGEPERFDALLRALGRG